MPRRCDKHPTGNLEQLIAYSSFLETAFSTKISESKSLFRTYSF